jgi:hypothetical protein
MDDAVEVGGSHLRATFVGYGGPSRDPIPEPHAVPELIDLLDLLVVGGDNEMQHRLSGGGAHPDDSRKDRAQDEHEWHTELRSHLCLLCPMPPSLRTQDDPDGSAPLVGWVTFSIGGVPARGPLSLTWLSRVA